jgi:hypothetical protein
VSDSKAEKDAKKKRKAVEDAQTDVAQAREALRSAEDKLSDAERDAGSADPGKAWPPEGLEFKTPPETEKK